MLAFVAEKKVDPQEQRLRDEFRRYVDEIHEGRRGAAAEAMGISAPVVTQIMNGSRGIGRDIMVALAQAWRRTTDDLLGLSLPRWRDLPGWDRLVAEGRERYPGVSRLAWEYVGNLYGPQPPAMDAAVIATIAMQWDAHATAEQRANLDDEIVDGEMREHDEKVSPLPSPVPMQAVRKQRKPRAR